MNRLNFFTSQQGADVIVKRWKRAGIGVLDGTIVLPSEDPFSENGFKRCVTSVAIYSCSHHLFN